MREWLLFGYLSIVWGAAFYWIKVAVEELGPLTLVASRLSLATFGLYALMKFWRQKYPRDLKTNFHLFVMGLLSPLFPLSLVSWAEIRLDSTVASILNSTVPFFTILFAHFFLSDERMSRARFGGLVMGFVGVVVLMSRDLSVSGAFSGSAIAYGAIILAAAFYGISAIYSRRYLKHVAPIAHATGNIFYAAVISSLGAFLFEHPQLPQKPMTWLAILWLGLFATCTGFAAYFTLLPRWGATRTSLVNYVLPVVGVALGLIFRGERLDWYMVVGAALIMGGIVVVNYRALLRLMKR